MPKKSWTIEFACCACGKPIKIANRHAAAEVRCPKCATRQLVPSDAAPPPPLPPRSSTNEDGPLIDDSPQEPGYRWKVFVPSTILLCLVITWWVTRTVPNEPSVEAPAVPVAAAANTDVPVKPPSEPKPSAPAETTSTRETGTVTRAPVESTAGSSSTDAASPFEAPTASPASFAFPLSREQIRQTLDQLRAKVASNDEQAAALSRLQSYRFLCGLPYADLTLDPELTQHTLAAATLCERIGELDHNPPNPGMSDADYEFARQGTSHSNLSVGTDTIDEALDMWMDDSDKDNVDRLGHRRWCLNPAMQKTGFGRVKGFVAMWAFDDSRRDVPEYEFVSYPPPGYFPLDFFARDSAWSVTLNPQKFQPPVESKLRARIYPLRDLDLDRDQPLKLNYVHLDLEWFAIPNCIIFRPANLNPRAGDRYWVEISGLERLDATPAVVSYLVEFAPRHFPAGKASK